MQPKERLPSAKNTIKPHEMMTIMDMIKIIKTVNATRGLHYDY